MRPYPRHVAAGGSRLSRLLVLLALHFAPVQGLAHESRSVEPDATGLVIESVNHGAMQVLQNYRRPILALANGVTAPDETLNALLLYNHLQHANCLWLIIPGSITDEDSPFNECAHADLAGLKAILAHLRQFPSSRPAAEDLIGRIDHDMVLKGTSFVTCAYSTERFNTFSQIRPDWAALLPFLFGGDGLRLGVGIGALIALLWLILRRRPGRTDPDDRG
ncbi:hypothetical protein [Rhizobium sp. SSA_523]|uniref:hypothetical protein n=1 Tax=Rhizobium sp. SSA_523 TaxID=2952477 RepID=UPI0020900402|nr:hypothetical protein [Rhizobium sp. SSA_523]MCO5732230.1 hypothetical protein [Rhizobium sp. SSA_523]WKC21359.1 hypothetical protein QTJ18_05620 [Rhizobium sp. SSA_523]